MNGPHQSGTLCRFLAEEDITPLIPMGEGEWARLRKRSLLPLLWHFCTWRNLVAYRGFFPGDILGFGWSGIYRSLLVPSIVATSYRNEGHFRPPERIEGTESFFEGAFRKSRTDRSFREVIRQVNLRHHVAGIVRRVGDDVEVMPGYEADFAYVSTAFIEGIRRGYEMNGVPRDSARGRRLAGDLCSILYQVACLVGLRRAPASLRSHEKFCIAFEKHHDEAPPSPRNLATAREIARKIFPITAAFSATTPREHLTRHLDKRTAAYLFPAGTNETFLSGKVPEGNAHAIRGARSVASGFVKRFWGKSAAPSKKVPELDHLWAAYDSTLGEEEEGKLIGSILLFALASDPGDPPWHRSTKVLLSSGEPLIRQGDKLDSMLVLLKTTSPLRMIRVDGGEEVEITVITGPTVLGEASLWYDKPSFYSVVADHGAELEIVSVDRRHFEALRANPAFRTATAAEVRHRLRLDTELLENLLESQAAHAHDDDFNEIARLLRYITGELHASLDGIRGLAPEATLAECVELLRIKTHRLATDHPVTALRDLLEEVVDTIR